MSSMISSLNGFWMIGWTVFSIIVCHACWLVYDEELGSEYKECYTESILLAPAIFARCVTGLDLTPNCARLLGMMALGITISSGLYGLIATIMFGIFTRLMAMVAFHMPKRR